jgi:hypothetical protein
MFQIFVLCKNIDAIQYDCQHGEHQVTYTEILAVAEKFFVPQDFEWTALKIFLVTIA